MLRGKKLTRASTGARVTDRARRRILRKMVPGTVPIVGKATVPKTDPGTETEVECNEAAKARVELRRATVAPRAAEQVADATDRMKIPSVMRCAPITRRTEMKKTTMTIFLICMLSLPFVSSSFAQKGGKGNGKGGGNQGNKGQAGTCEMVAALPLEDLSGAEEHYITLMREEEKLARDVYLTLSEDWDLAIFANIAGSEQRHMDAVGSLIAKYGLIDPVVDDTVGAFTDPEFTKLYEGLVLQGRESVVDALQVGAFIEDLDIADLLAALEEVDNADITMVFEHLLQGSGNHYSAFTRLLAGWGESYEPEFVDADDLEAILSTLPTKGRGGKGANSMSRRSGQGRGTAQGPQDGSGPGDGSCPFGN